MNYTKEQAWELISLALCIWREARNQSTEGKLAVGWSVRNRVFALGKNWWGNDWEEVILKRWQYTSFEKTDPNAYLLPGDPAVDQSWKDSLEAAENAYGGIGIDPTNGATHYYSVTMPEPPPWVNNSATQFKIQIGQHRFYEAA